MCDAVYTSVWAVKYACMHACKCMRDSYMMIQDTEWRRPIVCLELQVSFRKMTTNCRALLCKMTYKDKASYVSSPPCMRWQYMSVCAIKCARMNAKLCAVHSCIPDSTYIWIFEHTLIVHTRTHTLAYIHAYFIIHTLHRTYIHTLTRLILRESKTTWWILLLHE